MNFFDNFKIGQKLAVGFGFVLILLIALASYAVYTAYKIDSDYSYMGDYPTQRSLLWSELETQFYVARRSISHSGFFYDYPEEHQDNVAQMRKDYEAAFAEVQTLLGDITASTQSDPRKTDTEKAQIMADVNAVQTNMESWKELVAEPVLNAFKAMDSETAVDAMLNNSTMIDDLVTDITTNYSDSKTEADNLNAATTITSDRAIIVLLIISIISLVVGILMAVINTRAITKPIHRLRGIVSEVSVGKLNVNIDRKNVSKDEIGELTMGVATLVDTILLIVAELEKLSDAFKAGDIDARADVTKFNGSYAEVVEGVNSMVGDLLGDIKQVMNCLSGFGQGNFAVDIDKMPGKKAVFNKNIDGMRDNLKNVSKEITYLVTAAGNGELTKRVEANKYSGDWAVLLDSLNQLMGAISEPISEAEKILNNIAAGNFEHQMHGEYKGAFLTIKNSVNETVKNIDSYIEEISAVLNALAQNDLNQEIKREYVGDFSSIKVSIGNIIKNLNEVISQIYAASEQVATGAHAISEGSMTMAQGATEQASSIEELNATVQIIADSTSENAANASEAENLSKQSKETAALGDSDMNNMLKSMDGIKASSDGISKIIKVIDDIAFQTNILSLNAAVEAARAGEHGKGFAVVAEEVRNLAARSQSSAHDTAELIEESINRVNEGMAIAGKTASALRQIVESVTKVSEIIEGITRSSAEQSSAISQVMEAIHQITGVIQSSSSTTEEAASAAEELSSQAEVLRSLVDVFKLKA